MTSLRVILLISVLFTAFPLRAGAGEPSSSVTLLGVRHQASVGDLPHQPQNLPLSAHGAVGVVDTFTRLNVRDGPGTSFRLIGKLEPGEVVKILGERDGWLEILWNSRAAWICGVYVFRPGRSVRNQDILEVVRSVFGAVPGVRFPPAGQPAASDPPAPAPTDGGRTGATPVRSADGGLSVPLYDQLTSGGKYPKGFCGPTSLKMVLAYYGKDVDINTLALKDVGGATPVYHHGEGSSYQGMLDMLEHCGLTGSTMGTGKSIEWLKQQTDAGNPVIVCVRGNYGAGFYTPGHIVVVTGVTSDGRVIINDPWKGKRLIVSGSKFYSAWNKGDRMGIVAKP